MNITFRQLRVFTEVAQQGSMIRAAAALHLTPPAVSMQIKEVEAQVGLSLFDRHGRQVSLSTAGEYFLVHDGVGVDARVCQCVHVRSSVAGLAIDGDRKSTRLNSSHPQQSRMPSSA